MKAVINTIAQTLICVFSGFIAPENFPSTEKQKPAHVLTPSSSKTAILSVEFPPSFTNNVPLRVGNFSVSELRCLHIHTNNIWRRMRVGCPMTMHQVPASWVHYLENQSLEPFLLEGSLPVSLPLELNHLLDKYGESIGHSIFPLHRLFFQGRNKIFCSGSKHGLAVSSLSYATFRSWKWPTGQEPPWIKIIFTNPVMWTGHTAFFLTLRWEWSSMPM